MREIRSKVDRKHAYSSSYQKIFFPAELEQQKPAKVDKIANPFLARSAEDFNKKTDIFYLLGINFPEKISKN